MTLAHCLTSAWKELCGEDVGLDRVVAYEQAVDVCAVEEPTLVLNVFVKLERGQTGMALLVPFAAIGALLARLHHPPLADAASGRALAASLASVGIELRAQVGELDLSVEDVLGLGPGDVLPLAAPAAQGVVLYADGVPLHAARPGRNGGRRAVQVDSRLGGEA